MAWTHGPPDKLFQFDEDLDGFFEWQIAAHKDADSDQDEMVITQYDPVTRTIVYRKTYTHSDTEFYVRVEKDNGSGTLELERQFSMPLALPAAQENSAKVPRAMTCSPADVAFVKLRLKEAMLGLGPDGHEGGIACLNRLSASAKAKKLQALYVGRQDNKVNIICDSSNYYDGIGFFSDAINLHINMETFKAKSENEQRRLLFHEMLHELGLHEVDPAKIPRVNEVDPTQACVETCWPNDFSTKCSCATCLGTNTCDLRCSSFRSCNPVMAFRCPCPFKETKFYKTCGECLTGCPSGLSCFGFSTCEPVSVASEACSDHLVTCP